MFSFIAAMAPVEGASSGSSSGQMMTTFVTFGLIILIFWFLIIRPQRKKDKEAKQMLESLKKGDKIVSIGGIHGTVTIVKDNSVIVKVDDNTRIEFNKSAISTVLNRKAETATSVKKENAKPEIEKKEKEAPAQEKKEKESSKK